MWNTNNRKRSVGLAVLVSSLLLVLGLPACIESGDSESSTRYGADTVEDAIHDSYSPPQYADASADSAGHPQYDSGPGHADAGYAAADLGTEGEPDDDYQSGENYGDYVENEFTETADDALATFSIDVDTASYTLMRRDLRSGQLPVPEGVRVEEYLNFFDYDYLAPTPESADPFSVHIEAAPSVFGEGLHLLRIAIQGMEVPEWERDPANLVFLIDVSGSMQSDDKLPLVKFALQTLVNALGKQDTIGIVVYAGHDSVLLEPTRVQHRGEILEAIEQLAAGGSTAGEAGIRAAYDLAEEAYRDGGINRVVLCTDGDFNVGMTGDDLVTLIEDFRDRGITLTTLGFGRGNYNDQYMEQLADHGNGNYAYIDSRNEALRVLGENLVGTLQVIAKDVKIQVVLNPETVVRYRLVGYDNRVLEDWEFNDDTVDAGEIGSSHSVTAFLELELAEGVEPGVGVNALADVLIRYKQPDGDESTEIGMPFNVGDMHTTFDESSYAFQFAAAVTELAEILRQGLYSEGARFQEVFDIAMASANEEDPDQSEFLGHIATAASLW